jgi:hypothetical protein
MGAQCVKCGEIEGHGALTSVAQFFQLEKVKQRNHSSEITEQCAEHKHSTLIGIHAFRLVIGLTTGTVVNSLTRRSLTIHAIMRSVTLDLNIVA